MSSSNERTDDWVQNSMPDIVGYITMGFRMSLSFKNIFLGYFVDVGGAAGAGTLFGSR